MVNLGELSLKVTVRRNGCEGVCGRDSVGRKEVYVCVGDNLEGCL